jgi:hypothetical protein
VDEVQLNILKAHIKPELKLVGEVSLEITVSAKTQTNLTDDALKNVESAIQVELEAKIGKLSVKVSKERNTSKDDPNPAAKLTLEWPLGGGDDKKETRAKMKAAQTKDPKVEKVRVRIKKEYEAARDKILDKLPDDVKEKARSAMDDAVNEGEPFDASRLKDCGIGSDVLKEMTKAVQDYLTKFEREVIAKEK